MSDSRGGDRHKGLPDSYVKIDDGYSQSRRYLIDKLRYNESVADFRSIRSAILNSGEFSVGKRTFQFSQIVIPMDEQ